MFIKDMFAKEIDRDIKGVIKVGQADDENVKQELEEYVVTRELAKHFADFFSNYKKGIVGNTDKMGVWISGFFGSGKSHFLKILSYLLENRVVDGKTALDYFVEDNKISDNLVLADMKLAADTSADVILFNIDSKSSMADSQNNKEAILSVFLKVFNQQLGFYGANPHLADLERTLTEENHYEQFKTAFADVRGKSWEDSRHQFRFVQDDVCEALVKIGYCSQEAAKNLCESFSGAYDIDIHTFAKMVKKHIDSKGNNHHVAFMVDEIGQYIGERTDLMLNLQTVAEDLGTECHGKAWIIVTSQQDIDSITKVKGNDFSKIQGRFDTRLSLSSADVSEVIKKRLLEKTQSATQSLKLLFEEKEIIIKNLIMWNDGIEKKLYKDRADFASVYPFIPYQFNLLGDVLTSIRTHGASGKHLAEGERSMLSLFRESAMCVMQEEETALVPFSTFYNALEQFLDHSHKVVITRAFDNEHINPHKDEVCFEVEVLKTLFMIKYADNAIVSNIENITSLMASGIDESRIALKDKTQKALTKLCRQNYVQNIGAQYIFLSNEEQEINREIESQPVDPAEVTGKIAELIFEDLYEEKRYKYPKFNSRYTFGFNQMVDDRPYKNNQNFDITLRFLTPDFEANADEQALRLISSQGANVLVSLPNDRAFIDEMRAFLKIEKYMRLDRATATAKSEQIKIAKTGEMRERKENAKTYLEEALKESVLYSGGDKLQIAVKDIRTRINEALGKLVQSVYHKLQYIDTPMGESNIKGVLKGQTSGQITLEGESAPPNTLALDDVRDFVAMNSAKYATTSAKTVKDRFTKAPYGFIEDDVEWLLAKLFKAGDISFYVNKEAVTLLNKSADEIYRYLNRKEFSEKLHMEKREKPSDKQRKIVNELARELFSNSVADSDDDAMMSSFVRFAEKMKNDLEKLEIEYKNHPGYPGLDVVKNGKSLLLDVLSFKNASDFFKTMEQSQAEYFDFADDFAPVTAFFEGEQRSIWDKATKLTRIYEESKTFIVSEAIENTIAEIKAIMKSKNPYREIRKLPQLLDAYTGLYSELLSELEKPVLTAIEEAKERTFAHLQNTACKELLQPKILNSFTELREKATQCNNVATLQNIKLEADTLKIKLINLIDAQEAALTEKEETPSHDAGPETGTQPPPKPVKRQKTVSIKQIHHESTWRIESEQDVDSYIEKLRAELRAQVQENLVLNVEF